MLSLSKQEDKFFATFCKLKRYFDIKKTPNTNISTYVDTHEFTSHRPLRPKVTKNTVLVYKKWRKTCLLALKVKAYVLSFLTHFQSPCYDV